MPILRISQQPGKGPHQYRVVVGVEGLPDRQSPSFSQDIEFELTPSDGERIRWYLEDFLQFDEEPAPQIAKRVESLMAQRGETLFRDIFEGSNSGRQLWTLVEPHLSSTRIEIMAGIEEATAIPWELIRNPYTKTLLALSAQAFVRTQESGQQALSPQAEADKVRILVVICRPKGGEDVPFRSVASRLLTRLSDGDRESFQLDVLRPPTFEQLASTLARAKDGGHPYHIVHFDGHGVYAVPKDLANAGKVLSSMMLRAEDTGPHGYLMFEDPESETNGKFVDGFRIGALLRDARVPVLVLNACQSAFAEAPAQPDVSAPEETRNEVEAFGSLAQAVMEAGAAGVVAMRYSVYVVTAAQFVTELYDALARGRSLGEATTWARKDLANHPERRIAYDARPLQDWCVPVVWERTPLRLWPETGGEPLKIKLNKGQNRDGLDPTLPERPDAGFYGRDETLYALDRAFDKHRIVLLHAYAGSGKTSTAAEFARWYKQTGGVQGPVLFTSFERYQPLPRVLDKIGTIFRPVLDANGILWEAITDPSSRREIALQILRAVPALWIWDNVEPVTGFPAGTLSEWSSVEQQELRAFLSAARETKAKILLTSRRDETAWLGDLPRRVRVPPMPMQERLQLASAIVDRRGKRLADMPDLRPLLSFSQGNPLTVVVTVGEALRQNVDTRERLYAFLEALRNGEAAFEEEEMEGRSKSLGASLSYGFTNAFTESERKTLALLHLFQGCVDVDALRFMGSSDLEWSLDSVRGITRERGIELLDRAAEVGLLTALGSGYYNIHPALPWYFRALFDRYYVPPDADNAKIAFVEAMGEIGDFYHNNFSDGHREILELLVVEEDNFLAAWRLARVHSRWGRVISAMQGLRMLYMYTGRMSAWERLVLAVVPDFVDPLTDGPVPGREAMWSLITDYRVRIARDERALALAERLQRLRLDWNQRSAAPALQKPSKARTPEERNRIRSLAASFHLLAMIQREKGDAACADTYRNALDLAIAIGDIPGEEVCAYELGSAYITVKVLRDLDLAEYWCQRSMDLCGRRDDVGLAQTMSLSARIELERHNDALSAGKPVEELADRLDKAARKYEDALKLTPLTDITNRAIIHDMLGVTYNRAGRTAQAFVHWQRAINYREQSGDRLGAARARFNVALALRDAGRLEEANAYAVAASDGFQTFGQRAAADIQNAERLITEIDRLRAKPSNRSSPR